MKTYVVGVHGHGWNWSFTVAAASEKEAAKEAGKFLGKNEIITYIRLK